MRNTTIILLESPRILLKVRSSLAHSKCCRLRVNLELCGNARVAATQPWRSYSAKTRETSTAEEEERIPSFWGFLLRSREKTKRLGVGCVMGTKERRRFPFEMENLGQRGDHGESLANKNIYVRKKRRW